MYPPPGGGYADNQFQTNPAYGPPGSPAGGPGGFQYDAGYGGNQQPPPVGQPPLSTAFFAAACSVMIAAFISALALLFSLEFVDTIEMLYLFCFGAVLAIIDTPVLAHIKGVIDFQHYITKYVELITRVTGKGVVFIFLGCSCFASMWANLETPFLLFLAFFLNMFVIIIGFVALGVGVSKSRKLEKARRELERVPLDHKFQQFSRRYPRSANEAGGLAPDEFKEMVYTNGGYVFEDNDLKLIYSALVSNPEWRTTAQVQAQMSHGGPGAQEHLMLAPKLCFEDADRWVKGGMVLL